MLLRRRLAAALMIMTLPLVLPAAMMLAGSVHWERSASPVAGPRRAWCWAGGWCSASPRWRSGAGCASPPPIAAAALTVAAFTVDAALGAPMQPGSLLNSRPIFGLRWYGFGNVTFAAYATHGLLLAGYVAHRLHRPAADRGGPGRRRRHRVRGGHLRGLALDGHRLRRGDRPDPGRALAAVLAVRDQAHRTEAAADRRLGASLAIGADLLPRLAARPRSAQPPRQLRPADHRRRRAGRGRAEGRRLGRDDHQPARHRFAGHRHRRSGS